MDHSQKFFHAQYLWIRRFIGIGADLLALSGCTPLTRGDFFTEIDEIDDLSSSLPVADAGIDQNIPTGNIVNLDGSGSLDPDLDPLAYLWTFTMVPGGSILTGADVGTLVGAMLGLDGSGSTDPNPTDTLTHF
ncbi:MAG: PKD domain-containing protein [Spirochaetaceae bacterium]|nr:PKD domain-containing protein [Spirochaetaceae bacterium]MDT8297683.1 PKD domain-containing protein [Spirochaetaceae bacterium]